MELKSIVSENFLRQALILAFVLAESSFGKKPAVSLERTPPPLIPDEIPPLYPLPGEI